MSDEGKPPPDFAMLRAVEVLASIVEKRMSQPNVPPLPIDVPVILFNENLRFEIGTTTRADVVNALGTGFPFPSKGWETYAVRNGSDKALLSTFFRDEKLIACEFYKPKAKNAPTLAPRDLGEFRLVPGEVKLGTAIVGLDERFTVAVGGPGSVMYKPSYELRFPRGVALRDGERRHDRTHGPVRGRIRNRVTGRRLCLLAALVAFGLAVTVFRPARTPGPLARDFEAYYAAGAAWNAGGDPWSRDVWPIEREIDGVVATRDELLPFVGPAPALLLWSPLARLPFLAATVVWLAFLALAFVALIVASFALTSPRPTRIEVAAAALFALLSGPMLSDISLGQAALLSAAAVAIALATFRRQLALAGVATFVAAIQPNLALPLAAALTQRRAFVAIAGAAAAFFALPSRSAAELPGSVIPARSGGPR